MAGTSGAGTSVAIDGRRLTLSSLDKLLYPAAGFTKAHVIDYYARIAPVMLPHLAGRALTLVRCPDGVDGETFFEKRCPPGHPDWVSELGDLHQCGVTEPAALVWLANLAALELHALQARADAPYRPTSVVFDLDPGPPAGVLDAARVALELRDALDTLGLRAVAKTSGSKGVHVAVPLHSAVTGDETKGFAHALGRVLARRAPRHVTTEMRKDRRPGKVLVDWSQNDEHKTTVCAYSLRVGPRPTVSTPVAWDELATAVGARDPDALGFEAEDVLARVEQLGDLYAPNLTLEQNLPVSA